jgi:plastocyanin
MGAKALTLFCAISLYGAPALGATLTGTITWTSTKSFSPVAVARDRHVCGRSGPIYDAYVRIDAKRRVAAAVVYLDDAKPTGVVSVREVAFDQKNCVFEPHVAASTRGSSIRFRSSDPVLHNVHITDEKGRTLANYAMPVMDQEVSVKPSAPGTLTISCASHSWMHAYVRVFDHPFFDVTKAAGVFEIAHVEPGEHTLVAWHPDIGRVAKKVLVPEDPKARIAVDLAF